MGKRIGIAFVVVVFGFVVYTQLTSDAPTTSARPTPTPTPERVLTDGRVVRDVRTDVIRARYAVSIRRYRFLGLQNRAADAAAEVIISRASARDDWSWIGRGFRVGYGTRSRIARVKLRRRIDPNTRAYDVVATRLPSAALLGADPADREVGLTVGVPGGAFTISLRAALPPGTRLPEIAPVPTQTPDVSGAIPTPSG